MWTKAEHIVLWDLASAKETHRLDGHEKAVNTFVFTPDSKMLVSSDSKCQRWWDVATGKELPKKTLLANWVQVMALAPDGGTLATGGVQGTVRLWNLATGKQKLSLGAHEGPVLGVAISPDGRTFATGGRDKVIRLWSSATGEEIRQLAAHGSDIWSLAFALEGRILLSSGFDETVRVWDVATGKETRDFPGLFFVVSPDGKSLVTGMGSKNKLMRFWNIDTGEESRNWPATSAQQVLAFSSGGRKLFSYDVDKKVHIWDVATRKELRQFEGHHFGDDSHDRIYSVAFSPDGKLAAFGGQDTHIALYDMDNGKQLRLLSGTAHATSSLAFSADNRVLASGDWTRGAIHLWEMATGKEFEQLVGHKGRIFNMAFSADGRLLLTGSEDTTALVWDLTGKLTGPKARPLSTKDVIAAWSDLSAADAVRGQKAVRALLAVPDQAMALFAREMKPARVLDAKRMERLIMDLDSELFKVRDQAMRELEKLGDAAAPMLRSALTGKGTLELKKRLEGLFNTYATFGRLRTLRAVQVLEQMDTQPSRALLARLADGVPEALVTREAKAAVQRLGKVWRTPAN